MMWMLSASSRSRWVRRMTPFQQYARLVLSSPPLRSSRRLAQAARSDAILPAFRALVVRIVALAAIERGAAQRDEELLHFVCQVAGLRGDIVGCRAHRDGRAIGFADRAVHRGDVGRERLRPL